MGNNRSEITAVWEPTLLRLTAFPSPSADFSRQEWWREIVGELPETKNEQPRTGERVEIGQYRDAKLLLSTQPTRIDWQYVVEDPLPGVNRLSTMGGVHEATEIFHDLMAQWLGSRETPTLMRLAFGAVLIQPVDSREQGYSLLKDYLHFDINFENASDFLYQINRKRESGTDNPSLSINRLAKWSVLMVQQRIILPAPSSSTSLYARLELDINTAAEYESELPQDKLVELFHELVVLGEEISEEGDIP